MFAHSSETVKKTSRLFGAADETALTPQSLVFQYSCQIPAVLQ